MAKNNPDFDHFQSSRKIGKNLLFTVNANIFILVYKRLKADSRKFNFCHLPFAVNVMLKLSNVCSRWKQLGFDVSRDEVYP